MAEGSKVGSLTAPLSWDFHIHPTGQISHLFHQPCRILIFVQCLKLKMSLLCFVDIAFAFQGTNVPPWAETTF